MARNFRGLIEEQWSHGKQVCVGLDSDFAKIPKAAYVMRPNEVEDVLRTMVTFNTAIIELVADTASSFKLNLAFYMAMGLEGLTALKATVKICHKVVPGMPVILDAKFADIGNTNNGYVHYAFTHCGADAITLNPYLGEEALRPFLDMKDKGVFILCRTSNPGSDEFQGLTIVRPGISSRKSRQMLPLYQYVAERAATSWNANGNCGLVVGATYPKELKEVRSIVGDMPLLIPGIGEQGGDLEKTVLAGKDSRGRGMIISSSRGVIFASSGPDFAEAARREVVRMHEGISACG